MFALREVGGRGLLVGLRPTISLELLHEAGRIVIHCTQREGTDWVEVIVLGDEEGDEPWTLYAGPLAEVVRMEAVGGGGLPRAECPHCGAGWIIRVTHPTRCPRCWKVLRKGNPARWVRSSGMR